MSQTATPKTFSISAMIAICALALIGQARAQGASQPDLGGRYRCEADPMPCSWTGESPSISQSGTKLDIKNDKGEIAAATLTSNITISAGGPLNSYGVIRPDGSLDWSNGTKWRKQ
ncbi:MAG TPA: hypothetical protein VGJ20_28730 [Xanthobacteraceae bacterium]|jgi:hypothetical protein